MDQHPSQPPADATGDHADQHPGAVRTVSFVSLGCPKNLVDSEKMLGLLAEDGLIPVSAEAGSADGDGEHEDLSVAGSEQDSTGPDGPEPPITPADAVVINTCGFLEASKNESVSVIRSALAAKSRGEVGRVVVAGCLVQRHRAKLLEWAPGVDALIGVFDRDKIVEAVRGAKQPERETLEDAAANGPRYWINANAVVKARELRSTGLTIGGEQADDALGYFESDAARLRLTPRHYAYLRVGEGCNQACAFCTIPSIRGKMRSKREPDVLAEARELLRDGAFELLLIGQDTTSWGEDTGEAIGDVRDGSGLASLLRSLEAVVREEAGAGWLRLMYAYPTTFGEPVIRAFAELAGRGVLLPYLDIPLQHASDRMLGLMRRNVSADQQRDLVLELRERVPGMAVRTTFITGFPGETEADHEALLAFIDEIGFDALGVFTFSPEPGTPAARLDQDPDLRVPDDVKARRKDELLSLQQTLAFEQAAFLAEQFDPERPAETGCRFDVLIDESPEAPAEDGTHVQTGRAYFQAPRIDSVTRVESRRRLSTGELVRCVVTGADGYDLIARPADEAEKKLRLPVLGA